MTQANPSAASSRRASRMACVAWRNLSSTVVLCVQAVRPPPRTPYRLIRHAAAGRKQRRKRAALEDSLGEREFMSMGARQSYEKAREQFSTSGTPGLRLASRILPEECASGNGSTGAGGASELVTQRELYGSWVVHGSVTRTKPAVRGPGVRPREDMPIENVDELRLKDDVLGFGNRCAFDDRKILIHIALAPHVPDHAGHGAEYIP